MMEAEYRWNFHGRWGAALFGGLAWVASDYSGIRLDETLPASGLGLRFRMIDSYRINARADYAWGRDDQGLYLSIGEAF